MHRSSCNAILLTAMAALAAPVGAATFTVTSAADSGTNSLRWAIGQANSVAGADIIAFNIGAGGPQTINLTSALPVLTTTITIDGTTQPGYASMPLIELNGSGAGAGVSGLTLTQANNLIKGLAINRFSAHGIFIDGGTGNHTITLCYIGTSISGIVAFANGQSGVWISASPNNDIGPGNLISGNTVDGVRLDHSATATTVIKGNMIGTSRTGAVALPNGFNGIVLSNGVTGTLIGGSTAADRNIISGNSRNGIGIASGSTGTRIEGNYIGLSNNGSNALGNGEDGVLVIDSPGNSIGGSGAGTNNVISANGNDGLELRGDASDGTVVQRNIIGLDAAGTGDLGNTVYGVHINEADSTQVGSGAWLAGGNLISGNGNAGVYTSGLSTGVADTLIQGNRIGTDINGNSALANAHGVQVNNGYGTVIGSSTAANLISGNSGSGIDIISENSPTIIGNRIGTNANGTADLGNGARGIWIRDTSFGAEIGSADHDAWTCNRACNLVSGNGNYGIQLGSNGYSDINIRGNFIGTDLAGSAVIANGLGGVYTSAGWGTAVGGALAGEGNLISGNGGSGIDSSVSSFLTVLGNRIGTNAAGTAALANQVAGVRIRNEKPNLTLGSADHSAGVCDRACNLISGNNGDGILIQINDPFQSANQLILGNFVGTALNGSTCLGNSRDGLRLESDFDFGEVGGVGALDGNRFACNSGNGINQLTGNYGNGFVGNTYFSNGLLAIDNGNDGVTLNDPDDADIWLENFPILSSAITSGATTTVVGTLDAADSLNYRVEFFASPSCDASGYGEGRTLVGSANVSTNASGVANFNVPMTSVVAPGQALTATATVVSGSAPFIDYSTSEFSACLTVRPPAPTASNNGALCNGQALVLSASTVSGASYAWTGPNGFSANVQSPSIPAATSAATGTYSVTAIISGVSSVPATTAAVVNNCSLSINNPAAVTEGNSGTTPATFTVSLAPTSKLAVTVNWSTANGTAVAPGDYAAGAGTLTIPANSASATITRNVVGDLLDEANETFVINLSNASGGTITDAQGTGTISDDDNAPTVSIANRSCTEGNSGSTACAFTISLGAVSGQAVGGSYATANGGPTPAAAGSDYTAVAATAWSIAAGQPSTTVNVNISGDTVDEGNETFLVNLAGLSNAAATGNDLQATGTITDDDAANGQLRMTECVAEISELVASIQITVERISGSNGVVGVSYSTANGSALAGSDYTTTNGALSWANGDVSLRTITVALINNVARENREDFDVNLSAPTGGASLVAPSSTQIWILDGQDQIFEDGFGDLPPCL